jgi:hypothetical protein
MLFIEASQPIKTLIVHDVTGKLVLLKDLNGDFIQVNLSAMSLVCTL